MLPCSLRRNSLMGLGVDAEGRLSEGRVQKQDDVAVMFGEEMRVTISPDLLTPAGDGAWRQF